MSCNQAVENIYLYLLYLAHHILCERDRELVTGLVIIGIQW